LKNYQKIAKMSPSESDASIHEGSDDSDFCSDDNSDYDHDNYYELLDEAIAEGDADFVDVFFEDYWLCTGFICRDILCGMLEDAAKAGHVNVIERLQVHVSREGEYLIDDDRSMECRQDCVKLAVAGGHFDACMAFIDDDECWDKDDGMCGFIAQNYYQLAYDTAKEAGNNDFCQRLLMAARPGRIFGDKQRATTLRGLLRREIGLSWRFV
jgi:hypothetical protein